MSRNANSGGGSGSKLGRNPFQKATGAKSAATASVTNAPDAALVGAESAGAPAPGPVSANAPEKNARELPADLPSAIAQIALVDLPAHAIVLGLKVFLLARDTFSKERS